VAEGRVFNDNILQMKFENYGKGLAAVCENDFYIFNINIEIGVVLSKKL
jgi:hypothetical protein